jgi:hypothetical protein
MESYIVILLCVFAFGGFIDAIVGGGGLIQTRRIDFTTLCLLRPLLVP